MGETKTITKDLVVKLTPDEKADLADQLSERIGRKDWLEDAKKVSTKKYAAQIEETVAEINDLSNKIRAGEELRPVKCEIRFDDPIPGYKTTYRLDTGKKVSSELMTASDMQPDLIPNEDEENDESAGNTADAEDGETVNETEPEKE